MAPRVHKQLARGFYMAHIATVILAFGFILCAIFTNLAEENSIGPFNLDITTKFVTIYYINSAILLIAVSLGITALYKGNRPCFWILYCTMVGVTSLVELAVGASAIGKGLHNSEFIRKQLKESAMENFKGDNSKDQMTKDWDNVQINFKCCGIDNYTDWQNVQFGRTSLKVPASCCLESLREESAEYCGTNLLPEHENASSLIYPKGCLDNLLKNVNMHLYVLGSYGVIVSILQLLLVGAASYLLITKRI